MAAHSATDWGMQQHVSSSLPRVTKDLDLWTGFMQREFRLMLNLVNLIQLEDQSRSVECVSVG